MSLQRALLLMLVTALVAGIVPTGIVLDRRLAREVEARVRSELAQASRLVSDRDAARAEAMIMRAREVARAPGLAEALAGGHRADASRIADAARADFGSSSVLVDSQGTVWHGPSPGDALVQATRQGEVPVTVIAVGGMLHSITLAPVTHRGEWIGAAGVSESLDSPAAGTIAALTRADVLIMNAKGELTAYTTSEATARLISARSSTLPRDGQVRSVVEGGTRFLIAAAPVSDVATMLFVRDLSHELEVVPAFRRVVLASGAAAVALGLLLGVFLSRRITNPVMTLATAADRLAAGDFDAPLMKSSISEIARLSDAFESMRGSLRTRISDVTGANRRLTDRQARLESSQSEILQRERLAVSSRLVAELSHEIRNPIANLRNCLEVVRRRVDHDPKAREFTNLAIDELLRMHELAERLLDLNRPRDPAISVSEVGTVVREVVVLATAGHQGGATDFGIRLVADAADGDGPRAAIAPDALKQILLNLVQNAREAFLADSAIRTREVLSHGDPLQPTTSSAEGLIIIEVKRLDGRVLIEVLDNGPGISAEIMPRIFDPFFTTKGAASGVGLGLFVAQGLVAAAGGRLLATNRPTRGVLFSVDLPGADNTEL